MRGLQTGQDEWEYGGLAQVEIDVLDTAFFRVSMQRFNEWMICKVLPHGKGTMHERQSILDIIRVITGESNEFDMWEHEKEMNKRKR